MVFLSFRSRWLFPAVLMSLYIYAGSVALGWHCMTDGLYGRREPPFASTFRGVISIEARHSPANGGPLRANHACGRHSVQFGNLRGTSLFTILKVLRG